MNSTKSIQNLLNNNVTNSESTIYHQFYKMLKNGYKVNFNYSSLNMDTDYFGQPVSLTEIFPDIFIYDNPDILTNTNNSLYSLYAMYFQINKIFIFEDDLFNLKIYNSNNKLLIEFNKIKPKLFNMKSLLFIEQNDYKDEDLMIQIDLIEKGNQRIYFEQVFNELPIESYENITGYIKNLMLSSLSLESDIKILTDSLILDRLKIYDHFKNDLICDKLKITDFLENKSILSFYILDLAQYIFFIHFFEYPMSNKSLIAISKKKSLERIKQLKKLVTKKESL